MTAGGRTGTTDDLDRAERLAAAATPGPWETDDTRCCVYAPADENRLVAQVVISAADAEFIAAARDLVPSLIARLQTFTAAGDALAASVVDDFGGELLHTRHAFDGYRRVAGAGQRRGPHVSVLDDAERLAAFYDRLGASVWERETRDTLRALVEQVRVGAALVAALDAAERGRNDDGPYWNTAQLVAALRAFTADWRALTVPAVLEYPGTVTPEDAEHLRQAWGST